ncbi:MAG TPA: hypothetical protein VJQ54_08815 [Candidatus Sulfotelmatobacter sp.]|nr:hypothetical protein [Candidatus Sulfotelmatobacter sp.]
MSENKSLRLLNAAGFLAGVLACLSAVRDSRVLWPPDELWTLLGHRQHIELAGGLALIAAVIVTNIVVRAA